MSLSWIFPWKKKDLSSYDQLITRERLVQGGRIVVIDDEEPLLYTSYETVDLLSIMIGREIIYRISKTKFMTWQ